MVLGTVIYAQKRELLLVTCRKAVQSLSMVARTEVHAYFVEIDTKRYHDWLLINDPKG